MPTENSAEMFIRLLVDAVEAHRRMRNDVLKLQNKARARRFMQLCRSDLNAAREAMEPLDSIQLMDTKTQDQRVN
ncbi:hypothetical protein [Roseovarius nitratireducens]|uniref:hypothetical protein n=1 Tax=Roseovarius nitratireducens TaxID=2044597 RepID=UPI000CE185E1|nr:hypothetical protein [Roseovarius nitratireducens]